MSLKPQHPNDTRENPVFRRMSRNVFSVFTRLRASNWGSSLN